MTWKQGSLYAMMETEDKDELGNPIKERSELWSGVMRFTPWTNEDTAVNGRDVTENEQQYVIPVSFKKVKETKQVKLDGVLLNVTSVSDLGPRWTMIRVKVYKQ